MKKWYESKGVWGGIVALFAVLIGAFGYAITPEDAQGLVDAFSAIGGAVGAILAIYGRIKAKDKIQ